MIIKKRALFLSASAVFCSAVLAPEIVAQERPRIVRPVSSRPINPPPAPPADISGTTRSEKNETPEAPPPPLTTRTVVSQPPPAVKRTADIRPLSAVNKSYARRSIYDSDVTSTMLGAIQQRFGIPYRYGSTGPSRFDCSGFVWAVFNDAGINFTRQSARSLWTLSAPVTGDERFRFGTLVFFNKLGHMGIVADENGFYHASSSKGITYSPFKGYWEKRIVGFRRLITPDVAETK